MYITEYAKTKNITCILMQYAKTQICTSTLTKYAKNKSIIICIVISKHENINSDLI